MTYKNMELRNVTEDIIKIDLAKKEKNDEEIKEIYKKNNIPTNELSIKRENNKIKIDNKYYADSIFGKIIGLKK